MDLSGDVQNKAKKVVLRARGVWTNRTHGEIRKERLAEGPHGVHVSFRAAPGTWDRFLEQAESVEYGRK